MTATASSTTTQEPGTALSFLGSVSSGHRAPTEMLVPSKTNPRKTFNEEAQRELTESVKRHGILQAILVRPMADGRLEIVCGERRWRSAVAAQLEYVPVDIRELSDEVVIELQIIENLHRSDVSELEEAEGYAALMSQGYTVDKIIEATKKTKSYIYARLKLCDLAQASREFIYKNSVSASIAILVARIPVPSLQLQALKEVTKPHFGGDPMSVRAASEHIQRRYTLKLSAAPFKTGDADLLPAAGSCTTCPKRTGNQPEVFKDINANVCTDPDCFGKKMEAHKIILFSAAEEAGQKVIAGADAKKVMPHQYSSELNNGWIRFDATCYEDPKHRTYKQLLGKQIKPTLLEDPHHEHGVIEMVSRTELTPLLKAKGIEPRRATSDYNAQQREAEKKAKLERAVRQEVFNAVREKAPATLVGADLAMVTARFFQGLWHENRKRVMKVWNWEQDMFRGENSFEKHLADMKESDVVRLLMDIALAGELQVCSYSNSQPTTLLAAAKRRDVDAAAIRRKVQADANTKNRPAKAANPPVKASKDAGSTKAPASAKAAVKAKSPTKKPSSKPVKETEVPATA